MAHSFLLRFPTHLRKQRAREKLREDEGILITREQAVLLAQLARTIRPNWDELALINAIGEQKNQTRHRLAAVVLTAADNPQIRTPRGIAFHAQVQSLPGEPAPRRHRELCGICLKTEAGHDKLARMTGDDHDYEPRVMVA